MALHATFTQDCNPLDRIERLAERHHWALDRLSDEESVMHVTGGWNNLEVALSWRGDLESLFVAATFDFRVAERRRDEVMRLVGLINSQLVHGHFECWQNEGYVVYRQSLLLSGGAELNDAQGEGMVTCALSSCQNYYPAFNFVTWGGQTAEEALENALLETQGEA